MAVAMVVEAVGAMVVLMVVSKPVAILGSNSLPIGAGVAPRGGVARSQLELGELLAGLGWHLGQRSTVPALLDKAAPGVEGTAPAARHPGVADPYATR